MIDEIITQTLVLDPLQDMGMRRKNNRQALRDPEKGSEHLRQTPTVIDILRSVDAKDGIRLHSGSVGQLQLLQNSRLLRLGVMAQQRIDQHVADKMHPLIRHALTNQIS